MQITVRCGKEIRKIDCLAGTTLLNALREHGYAVSADCNGRGVCGKCEVTVCGGEYGKHGKTVLACKTAAFEGCEVIVRERTGGGLTEGVTEEIVCDGEDGYGLAVDIGTTTVAYALVRLSDGKILEKCAELNRQHAFGADVISRIQSATEGNASTLCRLIRAQIQENLQRFLKKYALPALKKIFVCGNTTMLHLFCGESVALIGRYPFQPVFVNLRTVSGESFGLSAQEVTVLPSVGAFVGADIVAGAVAAGADKKDTLLVDIGTNGEILINANGKILCTSTAAGPCFEGANIECGMGGVAGAINSFCRTEGKNVCKTIENAPPRGICGAGLVDAICVMLEEKIIDETGAFAQGTRFDLTEGVWISQKDVRAFQLAKSAIYSGMSILSKRAGQELENQKNILIAGGLGFYLNAENARKTGLLPRSNGAYQHVIGNSALAGTALCMLSRTALERACLLAERAQYVDLSADPDFLDAYVENMSFEDCR